MYEQQRLLSQDLYEPLAAHGVDYFCGVPDSVTGPFSHFLEAHAKDRHVIAANEGNAIGLAIGYHVATGKIPLVYMQNSGLSNAIDPLASLADRSVFSTPMLLFIGWRGQPERNDEPHHAKQGAITPDLLRSLGIPFDVLARGASEAIAQVSTMIKQAGNEKRPHALLIEQGSLAEYSPAMSPYESFPMSREEAIAVTVGALDETAIIVSGIGKLSRELFEYRQQKELDHNTDLLVVGGMGHASSVALGIAQQKPERKVFCLDGDGSVLMHLGALATIGNMSPDNFYHIVFNNGSHDSVGGQPTAARNVDLPAVAHACGYAYAASHATSQSLNEAIMQVQNDTGPVFIEVKVHPGARAELSRPAVSPADNKTAFMSSLQ